jgi:hypothetical protein
MTQDEIIEMARKTGLWPAVTDTFPKELEAFAKLVADKAIAELESQEPVAWGVFEGNLHDMFFSQAEAEHMALLKGSHAEVRPLYTHPPQRTWVGLMDEEFYELDKEDLSLRQFVQAIEDKLKEKNT